LNEREIYVDWCLWQWPLRVLDGDQDQREDPSIPPTVCSVPRVRGCTGVGCLFSPRMLALCSGFVRDSGRVPTSGGFLCLKLK
jgi:hypothetical protein